MRKTILAVLLAGLVPAAASAQMDGGTSDGSYVAPQAVTDDDSGSHTGSSSDPNGNMGDVGRTGDRDAGADSPATNGAEGSSGSNQPDHDHEPAPLTGSSSPSP